MQAQALNEYIGQGIKREVYKDKTLLYLPFYFGENTSEPLCLIWSKDGTLSDGGRTLLELKKRLGDITPYSERIGNVLSSLGLISLEGGQKLVIKHFQTCIQGEQTYIDYLGGLSKLLRAISLINVIDAIEVDKYGEVSLC